LDRSDVVRHPLVQNIVDAYEADAAAREADSQKGLGRNSVSSTDTPE